MQLARVGWREREFQGGVTCRGLCRRGRNAQRIEIGRRPEACQRVAPVGLGCRGVGRQMLLKPDDMLPVCRALFERRLLAAPYRCIDVEHLLHHGTRNRNRGWRANT